MPALTISAIAAECNNRWRFDVYRHEAAIWGSLRSIRRELRLRANTYRALIDVLRKLIAIALLAVFGLPFASSLFALTPKSESSLRACCRRNGKHDCMMSMAERSRLSSHPSEFSAPSEKCPYCPAAILSVHRSVGFVPPSGQVIYAGLVSHPAGIVQAECQGRISRDRAHGKRGPPLSSL